jgi:hypothetical protein
MAADVVPVQRATFPRRWVRFVVRAALALVAMWVLHLAQDRYQVFLQDYAKTFSFNGELWLAWVGAAAGAGLLFGLAAFFPFSRVRYQWSRLLLAVLALLPVAEFWFVYGYVLLPQRHSVGRWFTTTTRWFGGQEITLAVLAGVAVASGFRSVDKEEEPGGSQSEQGVMGG